jgi:ectoine hydroxylase-related dioxygenase (phytanoyl-CoA dioxygenase family)
MQPILCPAGSVAVWDGRVWHGNAKKTSAGQRVVLHTSYQRMVVRPNEDFTQVADGLIERFGAPMSQLMGREDSIATKDFDYVKDYATFMRTANNGKT